MSSSEKKETDDETHNPDGKRVRVGRTGSPVPSCLFMKSDHSMATPLHLRGETSGDQRPEVLRGYPDQVLYIGRVTLGEKARNDMKVKRKRKWKGKESVKKKEQKKGEEYEEKEQEEEEEEEKKKNQKEKQKEAILRAACALLNTGGGVIRMEAENQDYNYRTHALGQDLEEALEELVNPVQMDDFFKFSQQGTEFLMFVKSWCSSLKRARICSISTGLHQRSATSARQVSSSAANELLQRKKMNVPEDSEINQFYKRDEVNIGEKLDFGENRTVDFKDFNTKKVLDRLRECLPRYISAFANTAGGFLLIGVNNDGKVTGCGRGISKEKLETCVAEICSKAIAVHKQSCSGSDSLSVEHRIIQVQDENINEPKSYVLAIKIPAFCCAVFEKDPDSWQIKDSQLCRLTAVQWLKMMESTELDEEVIRSFKQLSIKDTPPQCRTVYGLKEKHLTSLQQRLFPVKTDDISIVPDPLIEDLFEKHEPLQTLERREDAPGVLIFSRSWAVDIGRVRNRHVICDALLICQNSLPCLYTVVEEGSQDAWEYATSTAFHLKQKLVNVGGFSGRVCVVPKLVHCRTLELIPRGQNSPDGDVGMVYPDCYKLGSEDQIESVLFSLVCVLLSFTSALSDELGCEFLNLLTEEQFDFLQTYEDIRELFIHGLPGTGKTVLAAEKIKRIKNAYDCKSDNVLYICENQPLNHFMSKQNICFCETRKGFMLSNEKKFSEVQHIIVDEGQNFRDEDGDWIQKARNIVKENGVFWVFLDYFQQSHTTRSGLPPLSKQSNKAYLCTIVRNSEQVFVQLQTKMDNICKRSSSSQLAKHLNFMFSKIRFIHSFPGSYVEEKMAESEVVPYLNNMLKQLLHDGRSSKDIAILCSTKDDRENLYRDLKSMRSEILFTSAEEMDRDTVVLDSIRRFSGLERNTVILINPQAHPFQPNVKRNLLVSAISRARIHLIVIDLEEGRMEID